MKKLSALLLAGIFSSLPVLALAQDNAADNLKQGAENAANAVGNAANNAMQAAGNAMQSAADAVVRSTDDLAAKITAGSSTDVKAITETTDVKIVPLSSLTAGGAADAVANAVAAHTDWLTALRADVAANAALSAKLAAAGYRPDQVVYADAAADGSVSVYVDDKA